MIHQPSTKTWREDRLYDYLESTGLILDASSTEDTHAWAHVDMGWPAVVHLWWDFRDGAWQGDLEED